jgi:hypothetical protein
LEVLLAGAPLRRRTSAARGVHPRPGKAVVARVAAQLLNDDADRECVGVLDSETAPSDADRQHACEVLSAAVGQGVLTLEDFERFLELVYQARSVGELQVLASLSPPTTSSRPPRRPWLAVGAALGMLGLGLALVLGRADTQHHGSITSISSPAEVANPLPSGPPGTVISATCVKSLGYEQTEPAYLNQRFIFGIPQNPSQCAHAAGLDLGPRLAAPAYEHVHLDLFFEGGTVVVPAGVGVTTSKSEYARLFTQSDTGIIWVAKNEGLTLGQFFQMWGHPLGHDIIGSLHTLPDYPVTWYINGQPVNDPAAAVLHNHDEIFAFEDLRGAPIHPTASFDWPSGY